MVLWTSYHTLPYVQVMAQKLQKEDWIDAALSALANEGAGGIRVEALARELGVSKGSFYWHFKNREALFDQMLDRWESAGTLDIISHVDGVSDDPEERLRILGRIVLKPSNFDKLEANLRAWGATYEPAARRCAKVDKQRIEYVRDLLVGCGFEKKRALARADLLYLVLIGNSTRINAGGKPTSKKQIEELLSMLLS